MPRYGYCRPDRLRSPDPHQDDERRQQFYDTLLAESERLRRMVEGLLDFGRMESGRLEYEFAPVDVSALVKEVAADIERDAGDRACRVDVSAADDLPPVRGDRESLSRVFRNLLGNAAKYSPEERTVWVKVSNSDGRVRVDVRDPYPRPFFCAKTPI